MAATPECGSANGCQQTACPHCRTPINQPVMVAHLYQNRGNNAFAPTGRVKVLHHHAAIHDRHVRNELGPNENLRPDQLPRRGFIAHDEDGVWLMNEGLVGLRGTAQQRDVLFGQSVSIGKGLRLLLCRTPPAQLWWIDRIEANTH